ncbi:basic amino acid ABC transporter substrate-binding protein [Psychrilyobacter sp.]|uniref:basic amino acid ABC transporter substrate-binding protein n=1 Tax=Psychrilyobacter sp. TaxID=2586924 RepID=UPI00301A8827
MKKLINLVGILMMVVLVGCGQKIEVENTTNKIKKLYIGTNAEYKPYEYLENGKMIGFDIEFMEALAENLGYEIEWKNLSFDGLLPALQTQKIDMVIAGMSPTEERKKAVDFTDIYHSGWQTVLVNKKNKEIQSAEDLKGKIIGVPLGSFQEGIASKIKGTEVKFYNSFTGAVLELNTQKIDAVIVGEITADYYLENNKNLKKISLPKEQQKGTNGIAIALEKGQTELLKNLNEGIEALKSNGKYQELLNKYFGG